jgi:hypothetical protein
MVTMGKLPQTPRLKKAIGHAIEEARSLQHNHVGTEHLLLGLLQEEEGVAAQVLMNLGLRLEDVREEVQALLGNNLAPVESAGQARATVFPCQWGCGTQDTSTSKCENLLLFCLGFLVTLASARGFVNHFGADSLYFGALVGGGMVLAVTAFVYLRTPLDGTTK